MAGPWFRSSRLFLLLACVLLAACGSVPRPFSPGDKSGGLPPPGPSSALIVHPFSGTEGTPLEALTAAVIARLQENDVAATPYEIPNRYRMLSQADAVRLEGDTATLALHVQFARPDSSAIAEDVWEREVDWDSYQAGDTVLVGRLAEDAARRMLVLMGLQSPQAEEEKAASLFVSPIQSAPGDGAAALRMAMVSELGRLGVTGVTNPASTGLPTLDALVSVRPVDASNDLVRIIWLLKDGTGRQRGRLEQQNTVPTGRLSRRWGVVAQLAAAAAAPGVVELMQQLRAAD